MKFHDVHSGRHLQPAIKKFKQLRPIVLAVYCTILSVTSSNAQAFQEVKIGNAFWMAENLSVDRFRTGDTIRQAKNAAEWNRAGQEKEPVWSFYGYDSDNGAQFGKLYNWYAVRDARGLCPVGWEVPTDAEWKNLTRTIGVKGAGFKMKSTSGWDDYEGKNGNGSNASGFFGRPGGYCDSDGTCFNKGLGSYWWTSSAYASGYAWLRNLFHADIEMSRYSYPMGAGFSVRCMKKVFEKNPRLNHRGEFF